jgi:NAD(P)H-dependent FMN reductase
MASMHPPLRLLAVSGSLRAKSVNTAVLLAAQAFAPAGLQIAVYSGLGELPHFNPDLDVGAAPIAVARWRGAVADADALLFCTPEYAHGLPGSFKNALDWLVSFEGFINKPVAIIAARPGGDHAQVSLHEILTVMNARVLIDAGTTLPLMNNSHDVESLLRLPAVRAQLTATLATIVRQVAPLR